MEPVGLYCEECCKQLGKDAVVADCLHAFCYKEDGRKSCVSTTGACGTRRLVCPVCNSTRAAWRVAYDEDRMPNPVWELVYANVSFPITGISRSSVAKEIDIVMVRVSTMLISSCS